MKKFLIFSIMGLVALVGATPALAGKIDTVSAPGRERSEEVRADKAEKKETKESEKKFVVRSVKVAGTVSEVKTGAFVVKVAETWPKKAQKWEGVFPKENQLVTVKVEEKSKVIARNRHQLSLANFIVGDVVQVVGKLNEDGTMTAVTIKNERAIMHKVTAKIESIDSATASFTIKREGLFGFLKKGETMWTVKTDSTTEFTVPGVDNAAFTNLQVGDKVQVRGMVRGDSKEVLAKVVRVKKVTAPSETVVPTQQ